VLVNVFGSLCLWTNSVFLRAAVKIRKTKLALGRAVNFIRTANEEMVGGENG
jgi:hypothetical protein